jgi:hypothetical protein
VEIASAKPVKRTKKVALGSAVAPGTTRVGDGTSGAKPSIAGAKKATTPTQNCRIPPTRMLADSSSAES